VSWLVAAQTDVRRQSTRDKPGIEPSLYQAKSLSSQVSIEPSLYQVSIGPVSELPHDRSDLVSLRGRHVKTAALRGIAIAVAFAAGIWHSSAVRRFAADVRMRV
jgi:hypothetical protein